MDPYGSLSKLGPNLGDFGGPVLAVIGSVTEQGCHMVLLVFCYLSYLSCGLTPLLPITMDGPEWSLCAESSDKTFGEYIGSLTRYQKPLWRSLWTNQYNGMSNNGFVSCSFPWNFFPKNMVVNSRKNVVENLDPPGGILLLQQWHW